jgi:hypothetical protein
MCTNEKNTIVCRAGSLLLTVWVGEVRCGWGSSGEGFCGLRMCRILSGVMQLWFSNLCKTSTLWPEDGQARPKHVVTIAAINTIQRQLCFWRTLLPSFNIRKHNGDYEPEEFRTVCTSTNQYVQIKVFRKIKVLALIIQITVLCDVTQSGRQVPTTQRTCKAVVSSEMLVHDVTWERRKINIHHHDDLRSNTGWRTQHVQR